MSKKNLKAIDALHGILFALRLVHERHMSGDLDDGDVSCVYHGLLNAADKVMEDL